MARQRHNPANDAPHAEEVAGQTAAEPTAPPPDEGQAEPKKRGRKGSTPPELRSYYVMFGQPHDGRPLQRIGRYVSRKRAERFIEEASELLRNAYSAVEIVRCKRMTWVEIG